MPAAPKPCTMRATVSSSRVWDSAQNTEASVNSTRPAEIDPPIADDFAERGQRQQRDRDRELVAVDDPDRKRRARMQIAGDGRQRDIGDRAVDHRHHEAERDGQDRPVTLRLGQAVGVLDAEGRHGIGVLGIKGALEPSH